MGVPVTGCGSRKSCYDRYGSEEGQESDGLLHCVCIDVEKW